MFPLDSKQSKEPNDSCLDQNHRGTGAFIGLVFSLPLLFVAALTIYVVLALRISKPLWALIPLLCTMATVVWSGVWWAKRILMLKMTAVILAAVTQGLVWVFVYVMTGAITIRLTLHDPHPFSDMRFLPLLAAASCCALMALAMCFTIRWRIHKSIVAVSQAE